MTLYLIVLPFVAADDDETGSPKPRGPDRVFEMPTPAPSDNLDRHCATLYTLPPPVFEAYRACVTDAVHRSDLGIPGIVPHLQARCWCEHGLGDVVDGLGCCSHPDFASSCAMDCNADCSSAEAQRCLEDCPAICLEAQYAPPSCVAACAAGNCQQFVQCTTEYAVNASEAGLSERTCHERDFARSTQVADYLRCQVGHSHRSVWHTTNAAHFCACSSQLAEAVRRADCCDTMWGRDLCDLRCAADCAGPPAQRCHEICPEMCAIFVQDNVANVSRQCYDTCFHEASDCRKYAVCPGSAVPSYEYVCDDGRSPLATGCCESAYIGQPGVQCPLTCESHQTYHVIATAEPGLYSAQAVGNYECFCEGCPLNESIARVKLQMRVRLDIHDNGVRLLNIFAQQAGLWYPTDEMERLMDERNGLIVTALLGDGDIAEREREIRRVNSEYLDLVWAAAVNPESEEPIGAHNGADGPGNPEGDQRPWMRSKALLGAVVTLAGVIVILLGCIAVLCMRQSRKVSALDAAAPGRRPPTAAEVLQSASDLQRQVDDLAVVMGQPVRAPAQAEDECAKAEASPAVVVGVPRGRSSGSPDLLA